ncbi:MAG: hypothetical protein QW101_00570 [Ignisphaera sp.]|uniref:Uncharacterized protein n=1 Tax=Ignisphaera aggregans TaxID=334771 RepID=A0A7J3N0A1_9CREN
MSSYEKYVEGLLKLQKCYRIQNILKNDVVSKIDLITRPRVALVLAVTLWSINRIKQGVFSYGDIVYIQKRLAKFLTEGDQAAVDILKKMLDLIPMRYGMDISLAARRCSVLEPILLDTIKAFNMIRDVIDIATVTKNIDEALKHDYNLCLNDVDILPPTNINTKEYLVLILVSLRDNIDRITDPTLKQIIELLTEEIRDTDMTYNDQVAVALIVKLIADSIKPNVLCAEPCINISIFSQKLLNDLSALDIDPSKSKYYKLYQELSMRSIVHGAVKTV